MDRRGGLDPGGVRRPSRGGRRGLRGDLRKRLRTRDHGVLDQLRVHLGAEAVGRRLFRLAGQLLLGGAIPREPRIDVFSHAHARLVTGRNGHVRSTRCACSTLIHLARRGFVMGRRRLR